MERQPQRGINGRDFVNIGLVLIGALVTCMPGCITIPLGVGLLAYGLVRIQSGR